jgi:hypothetical protein
MKEKGERGNKGGGLVWRREKGRGGFGQMAIFLPWLAPQTEVGGSSGGDGPPASRPRLRTARGGKEGGRRGGSSPILTLG